MKAAIAWQSGDSAWSTLRPPLVELDEPQNQQLQDELRACDFKMPEASTLAVNA